MSTWTESEIATLKAAIASGVLEVSYDGPPRRTVRYQDLAQMRKLLAEMQRDVNSATTYRRVKFNRGFRDG